MIIFEFLEVIRFIRLLYIEKKFNGNFYIVKCINIYITPQKTIKKK